MDRYVIDIETNGLDPDTIWCAVVRGPKFHDVFTTTEASELDLFIRANPGDYYAHNGIGFDFPILERLWGISISSVSGCRTRDSLVLSRLASPSRSSHSLAGWGNRLGFPKGEHAEWDRYSPEMLDYCIRDTEVNWRVMEALDRELEGYEERSINLEHDVAEIIKGQEKHGWKLDVRRCTELLCEMKERKNDIEETVQQVFGPLPVLEKEVAVRHKKDGSVSTVGLGGLDPDMVGGDFSRISYPAFNLGSRRQIGERLIREGWQPKDFTPTGQPRVDEKTLEGVDIPEAVLIRDYLMLEKRIAMIESWLELVDDDDRIHGRVNSNGAVTGRMTHSHPNVAQVTAKGKEYGARMRACWTVPQGYRLVGCDADGLELRMLAHYMDDEEFTQAVISGRQEDGTDAHTKNQIAAGLDTRDQAKTFIYAFLYGAGDEKIGSIVGGGRSEGRALKARFLAGMPKLAKLKSRVEQAAQRGWLKGLDGRRILVRSQHAALNTLLQGAGAVVMKQGLVILDDMMKSDDLDAHFVGNIHDEWQIEAHHIDSTRVAILAEMAIRMAGEEFNLRCPLSGSATIGTAWVDTH